MTRARSALAVVVLTYNEEANLPECLESLRGLPCDLHIVDSGSTDGTLEIARRYGAIIASHPFQTHALQWRWALDNLPRTYDWVLGLDADQRLTPRLRDEIAAIMAADPSDYAQVEGFYLNRRQVFRGRWIRFGGYYPKYLLKLFRPSRVRFDAHDLIDHHFHVEGAVRKLRGDMIERNHKEDDISFWIEKHNRYAVLHAREELARRTGAAAWVIRVDPFGTPDQRVAWLKSRWYRLPLYLRPTLYFLYRYFVLLGILDGKEGFVFHVLQAFWYRLLVDVHLDQMTSLKQRNAGVTSTGPVQPARGARVP